VPGRGGEGGYKPAAGEEIQVGEAARVREYVKERLAGGLAVPALFFLYRNHLYRNIYNHTPILSFRACEESHGWCTGEGDVSLRSA
jgi:hypothetical protein